MLLIWKLKPSSVTEFSLEIWDLFELLTPSLALELANLCGSGTNAGWGINR